MDKNLFLKNMEEMIQIAKTNGNQNRPQRIY